MSFEDSHRFTWRSVSFTCDGSACFNGSFPGGAWSAEAKPSGLRWKAWISVSGGTMSALGDEPWIALDNALLEWVSAVDRIGTKP